MAEEQITQTQGQMESEFGMEGNVPADGETGYKTEDGSDAGEAEPGQGELPDANEIAKETSRLEEIDGLEDNLEIAEKQAEFDAEDAKEAEDAEETEGEEGLEGKPEDSSDEGEGDESGEDEGEGEAGEENGDPWAEFLGKQVTESADRQKLLDALLSDDSLVIGYRASGEDHAESFGDIQRRLASASESPKYEELVQTAKADRETADGQFAQAEALLNQAQGIQETLKSQVDDPVAFGQIIRTTGTPEYIRALHGQLESMIEDMDSDPAGFARGREMDARLDRIEAAVTRNGASPEAKPEQAAVATGPVPVDYGFQPGTGYPSEYQVHAFHALTNSVKGSGVSVDDVISAWNKGNRSADVFEVARSLTSPASENASERQKRELSLKPPVEKQGTSQKPQSKAARKPPMRDARDPEVAWDNIQNDVEAQVRQQQQEAARLSS